MLWILLVFNMEMRLGCSNRWDAEKKDNVRPSIENHTPTRSCTRERSPRFHTSPTSHLHCPKCGQMPTIHRRSLVHLRWSPAGKNMVFHWTWHGHGIGQAVLLASFIWSISISRKIFIKMLYLSGSTWVQQCPSSSSCQILAEFLRRSDSLVIEEPLWSIMANPMESVITGCKNVGPADRIHDWFMNQSCYGQRCRGTSSH